MNEKLRVYELAKEMLVDSKIVLRVLAQLNIEAKNHMSTLDGDTAQKVRDVLTGKVRLQKPKKDRIERPERQPVRPPIPRPQVKAQEREIERPQHTPRQATPGRVIGKGPAMRPFARHMPPPQSAGAPQSTLGPAQPGMRVGARPPVRPQIGTPPAPRVEPPEIIKPAAPDEGAIPAAPPPATQATPTTSAPVEPVSSAIPRQPIAPGPSRPQGQSIQRPMGRPSAPPPRPGEGYRGRPGPTGGPRYQGGYQGQGRQPAPRPQAPYSRPAGPGRFPPTGGGQRPGWQPPRHGGPMQGRPAMTTVSTPRPQQGGRGKRKPFQQGQYSRSERKVPQSRRGELLQRPSRPGSMREQKPVARGPRVVHLEGPLTVKDLAVKMGLRAADVIKKLISLGVMAGINQEIDMETAAIAAQEMGYEVTQKQPEMTKEELLDADLLKEDPEETLRPRPPVVTVMGHVDHGKTSLLDAIRESNVAAREAGGITQHIGASVLDWKDRKVVFLDTPGHEAFTAMRARGAKVTDIAVLVVAADDGVMPQTIEALNHARDAKVPIVVAINKMDKPDAKPDRVKQQLTDKGLVPEEWGGDTVFVPVSARQGTGIDHLLDMILLVADLHGMKANPDRKATGTVIEAELDKGRGPVATVLVQNGTLRIGDHYVIGQAWGKVRAMVDDRGKPVKKAPPSMPVEVTGLSEVPGAGDVLQVVEDERTAKEVAEARRTRKRAGDMQTSSRMSLEDLASRVREGEIPELKIVVKADVQGSAEALKQAIDKLETSEVKTNIIHGGVGGITESDVMFAAASGAIVIGFNVRPDSNARRVAEDQKVDIRTYRIIYDAVDDIQSAMKGMLKPKMKETVLGRAEVRQLFKVPKVGNVAGCYVVEGKITRNSTIRVVRDGVVVCEAAIDSLKRFKDDVREVASGYECGISLENFQDIKEADILEAFVMEEVPA